MFSESCSENGQILLETGSGWGWGSKRRSKGRLGGPGEGRDRAGPQELDTAVATVIVKVIVCSINKSTNLSFSSS